MLSYGQKGALQFWACAIAVAAACALLWNTIATDNNGIQPNEHRGAIPALVVQLNPASYLVREGGPAPGELCGGDSQDSDDETFETAAPVRQMEDTTFVQCDVDQRWGVSEKASPNFGRAMVSTLVNVAWWGATAAAYALLGLAVVVMLVPGLAARRRNRRIAERHRVEQKSINEAKRSALAAAWAGDKIDDLTYETRLEQLLREEDQ